MNLKSLVVIAMAFILVGLSCPVSAKNEKINAKKQNFALMRVERSDRVSSDTWIEAMEMYDAQRRIDACERVWDITNNHTTDNFLNYSANAAKNLLGLEADNALYPVGDMTSFNSADVLRNELIADSVIAGEFDIRVVEAKTFGGAGPLNQFTVEVYPKGDVGPGFLVDRFLSASMHEIKDQWTYTYVNPVLKPFTEFGPEDHYQTVDMDDPDEIFIDWFNRTLPPDSESELFCEDAGIVNLKDGEDFYNWSSWENTDGTQFSSGVKLLFDSHANATAKIKSLLSEGYKYTSCCMNSCPEGTFNVGSADTLYKSVPDDTSTVVMYHVCYVVDHSLLEDYCY